MSSNNPPSTIHHPLITIVGTTASGKSATAIKLAQIINGEIICADSRTIYKQMDICTAKPSKEEQALVPHHLIDVVEPNQKFSAAEFKRLAEKCIQEVSERGRVPILVGGTGLYIDSLLYNFQFKDKPNEAYRAQLLQMSDEELTTLLNTKNIDTSKLNKKNRRHVIRAIETNGVAPNKDKLRPNTLIVGLRLDKEVLKQRITERVKQMFEGGILNEIKHVSEIYGWENEALSGISYKSAKKYFEGTVSEEDVREAFIKRDLSLAKRQRTWFKRSLDIKWFENPEELIQEAISFVR